MTMLFTLSNKLCDSVDRYTDATHFTNRTPFVLVFEEAMIDGEATNHYIRLEAISIDPWPSEPLMVYCSLCERQPFGKSLEKVLSMTYEQGKFSRPKVQAQLGRNNEIEIELKTIYGDPVIIDTVIMQLSVEKFE